MSISDTKELLDVDLHAGALMLYCRNKRPDPEIFGQPPSLTSTIHIIIITI